ncbi:MAG: MBL fold metallo-hydrolase [Acetobacter sp.]|nr:MBL fold metallo-hydrolase [Acetobacter sp.]
MKIIVLGCGGSAGVPMIGGKNGRGEWGACDPTEKRNNRSRSSILFQMQNGNSILVDTTPDLRQQFLTNGITNCNAIIYTHAHADHIGGLDDIRAINRLMKKPICIYGYEMVLKEIQQRFEYVFRPVTSLDFPIAVLEAIPVSMGCEVCISGYPFTLFEQNHGYIFSTGVRCGTFAYSTDVVALSDESLALLHGVQTWMVDCFQRDVHITHAWLERVLEWRAHIQPRRMILTHMGVDMDWGWLQKNLPQGVEAAYDGMVIEVSDPLS